MKVRVGLVNVPTGVGQTAWERCFTETAARADLFTVNEAHSPRQKATYRRLAKRLGFRQFGLLRGPNPVFANKRHWRRVHGSQHKLHGRGPLYPRWPGFNSARYATVTVNRSKRLDDLDVTAIGSHLVPRGPKVPDWWRKRARKRSIKVLSRIVRAHLKKGRLVVLMLDGNGADLSALGMTRVAKNHVDEIWVACPAGYKVADAKERVFRVPTDHKSGVAADLRIERV